MCVSTFSPAMSMSTVVSCPCASCRCKLTSLHMQMEAADIVMYITMFRYIINNVSRMYYCDCQYCNIMICQCVLAALSPEWCTGNMNELAYLRAASQEVSHHILVDPFLITLHEMPSQWKRRVSTKVSKVVGQLISKVHIQNHFYL